jgi:hypothetical protein
VDDALLARPSRRRRRINEMAPDIVHYCAASGIRVILIDEAGALAAEQLRGISMISDHAKLIDVPLTIVLVGMNSLELKAKALEQTERRVDRWLRFTPWPSEAIASFVHAYLPATVALAGDATCTRAIDHLGTLVSGDLGKLHAVCMVTLAEASALQPRDQLLRAVVIAEQRKRERDAAGPL